MPDATPPARGGVRLLLDANLTVGEPKTGARRFWTTRELALIREHYPAGGVVACQAVLPGRSATSIYQKAGALGITAPGRETRGYYQPLASSAAIDEAIGRWYAAGATRDGLQALIRSTMRPRGWLTRRARRLGLTPPRYRPAPWTAAEDELLRTRVGQAPATIARALRAAGHPRTETAVLVRLKRMKVERVDDGAFTAIETADLLGVDNKVVLAWIAKGWLRAVHKTPGLDGSPWRITPAAIRAFVIDNVSALRLGRVDPHWFVDLLAHGGR